MNNIKFDQTKLISAIKNQIENENISVYKLSFILGVDRGNLLKIIKGKSNPSVNYFCKITSWLNQPIENFITNAEKTHQAE